MHPRYRDSALPCHAVFVQPPSGPPQQIKCLPFLPTEPLLSNLPAPPIFYRDTYN